MDIGDDGGLAILYLRRLTEVERRLTELEEEVRRSRGEGYVANGNPPRHEELPPAPETHRPQAGPPEPQLEGARMVVIEMLTSGYEPAQIATYLRETFAIDDPDPLLEEAGAVATEQAD